MMDCASQHHSTLLKEMKKHPKGLVMLKNFCYNLHYKELDKLIGSLVEAAKAQESRLSVSTQNMDVIRFFYMHAPDDIHLTSFRVLSSGSRTKVDFDAHEMGIALEQDIEMR